MMSKSKSLVTLTDIDVQSNQPEIAISMTGGLHTLKAVTVNQNVWETIGFLACELITASAEIRDRVIRGPVDLVQFFRFDIDSDLRLKMSNQYHEMGDCDLVRMNEDIINGFDEINGNNAVSQSMGIADLATLLSKEAQVQANTETDKLFNRLCDMLTKLNPWDHDTQGTSVLDAVDEQTGTKIDLVVVHAVGNIYAEGTIGKFGIRIFKASNIQVYIGWGSDFPVRPEVFLLHEREKLIRRLHDAVGVSANSPT